MKTLLNIIWFVLSGLWLAIMYVLAGLLVSIFIVTIPFGVQSFKLAGYALWPFGRTVVKGSSAGAGSVVGNIIWLIFAGWWLAIGHLLTALVLALTIIGLPLAYANVKLIPVALWPFGREIVRTKDVATAMAQYRSAELVTVTAEPMPELELAESRPALPPTQPSPGPPSPRSDSSDRQL